MQILHLVSSPRGNNSFSRKLGNEIVEKILSANTGSILVTHDLTKTPFPHLEEVHLTSFFTPEENRTPELLEAVAHSDRAIDELMRADVLVIDVPMYNFGIPSTLKTWIDHIARAGKTFSYSEKGPQGLVTGKKVYLAIASGGVYSEGPMKAFDFTETYLRSALGFLGMTDIAVVRVEGIAIPDKQADAMTKAIESIAV